MIRIFTSICIAFVFFNGACIVFIFPSPAHGRNLRLREHQSSLSVPLCLLLVWNRSVCTFVPSSGSFVAPQQATTALLFLVAYNITPAAVTDQNTKSWKFLPKRSKTPLDHHNVTLRSENTKLPLGARYSELFNIHKYMIYHPQVETTNVLDCMFNLVIFNIHLCWTIICFDQRLFISNRATLVCSWAGKSHSNTHYGG